MHAKRDSPVNRDWLILQYQFYLQAAYHASAQALLAKDSESLAFWHRVAAESSRIADGLNKEWRES